MKALKVLTYILSISISLNASAKPNYGEIFAEVEPCFILYDLNKERVVESFNSDKCRERISPCSTFKIPLSLMGFDSGILKDENNPKWMFKPEYRAVLTAHRKDHEPKSWIANGAAWYSQVLTQKLGMKNLKSYVDNFSYGNQDLTGDPGKNNGLTNSWLNSSLKISANEQIEFLEKLIKHKLPISKKAMHYTKNVLYIEKIPSGWNLYGKTGSAFQKNMDGSRNKNLKFGWFVGWLEKSGQTYIFAVNIHDKQKISGFAGIRSKAMAKKIFANLDILE